MNTSIRNNLTALLKTGAFDSAPRIEPMSPHKWRRLVQAAERLGVLGYVAMGNGRLSSDLPALKQAQALSGLVTFQRQFPLIDASLFNHWSDKRLMEVREGEMNAPDTSEETLFLLDTIVANAHSIVTTGINVEGILSLGRITRQHHNSIDTDKLRSWLSHIGLVQTANFEANILIECWDFHAWEIPFYRKPYPKVKALHDRTLQYALDTRPTSFTSLTRTQFSTLTRLNIALVETLSYKFMSAISKITDIEE